MEGFFNTEELQSDQISKGKLLSCVSCKLYKKAETPKMKPYGNFKKKVMVIGEFPSGIDDEMGKPFLSGHGELLKTTLRKLGFNLKRDAISLNAVNCHPNKLENYGSYQIDCCRRRVQQAIDKYKPKLILLLGTGAVESVIGKYWKEGIGGIIKWRGWCIPDQQYQTWICPTLSPSYMNTLKKGDVAFKVWHDDLKRALKHIKKPFIKQPDLSRYIEFCHTDKQVHHAIKQIKKSKVFTIDYEATGLRPFRKGHRLVCTGIAISPKKAFVWENTPKRNKLLASLMRIDKIKKIAHNIQMEDLWTSYCLGVDATWYHCSMNSAHVLDNRRGINGLKFQTYINFGVANYNEDVSPYLKGVNVKKYGANAINKIDLFIKQYGIEKLFEYCGLDNIFTYMLTLKQMKEIRHTNCNI